MMKTLIGIPCRDDIKVSFVENLNKLMRTGATDIKFSRSGLVFDARDEICAEAINKGYTHVLFIDSDMTFAPDSLLLASARDKDILTGLYFKRREPIEPVVYKKIKMRDETDAYAITETDIDREIFRVEGCGMGFCLIKVEVLKKIYEKYGTCFAPLLGLGEDFSFCERAKWEGFEVWCDSVIQLGHVGEYEYTKKDYIKSLEGRD